MYLLIYDAMPNSYEHNEYNWKLFKNLEQLYKFTQRYNKYEFLDCYKISKTINLKLLKKYKNKGDNK